MGVTVPDKQPKQMAHFTPLRYPGGKAKLAAYIKELLKQNRLLDGEYIEPYAGGAGVALELLLQEYVSRIHINDVSRPVFAFWKCVLVHTEELCRRIRNTRLTVAAWDRQKRILRNALDHDDIDLGFATFFLNRTNRSGILNGGIIGGREQTGPWKIDARYNPTELVSRVEAIAMMRDRIKLTRQDALKFLKTGIRKWPANSLIYLDPPYYLKGRALYYDFYAHADHADLAKFVLDQIKFQRWIVSYDNVHQIRSLYEGSRHIIYDIGYSARAATEGSEVMFFCGRLNIPKLVGPVKLTKEHLNDNNKVA